jgi:hypothetical protein
VEANSTGGQGSRRAVATSDDDDDDDDDDEYKKTKLLPGSTRCHPLLRLFNTVNAVCRNNHCILSQSEKRHGYTV